MSRSVFISFEGSEGCGKTTQINLLKNYFESINRNCVLTREPGGSKLSEQIRNLLLDSSSNICSRAELLLFAAARAQHVEETIRPALQANKIVLCDRFYDSTTAYQGAARKLNFDDVKSINDFAVDTLMPDITFLMDIDVSLGLSRASKRDNNVSDRMGSQKLEFYNLVRNSFLEIAKKNPHRFIIIDASKNPDEIFEEIKKSIGKFLNE